MNRNMNVSKIIARASNVKGGVNPTFTIQDFYEIYPQFFENPEDVKDLEEWVDVADIEDVIEVEEDIEDTEHIEEDAKYTEDNESVENTENEEESEETIEIVEISLKPLIPTEVMEMYIELAHGAVKQSRYKGAWKHCMCLFVAHFTTLYMQSMSESNVDAVIHAGQTKGLVTSKSVDGVSISYDSSSLLQGLDNFASWKLTTYGVQFITFAKTYNKGGMYVM